VRARKSWRSLIKATTGGLGWLGQGSEYLIPKVSTSLKKSLVSRPSVSIPRIIHLMCGLNLSASCTAEKIVKNRHSNITVQEVTDHVIADGILPHAYDAQRSSKERCRAAALMTFLLKCDINPYICRILARPEMSTQGGGNENTLFEFAECE
jgi:hypothetical protein